MFLKDRTCCIFDKEKMYSFTYQTIVVVFSSEMHILTTKHLNVEI